MTAHSDWAGNIVWLDFTKSGRVSNVDLNDYCDLVAMILKKKPQSSAALVVCPFLVSEKVSNGQRGEIRTGYCKCFFLKELEKRY